MREPSCISASHDLYSNPVPIAKALSKGILKMNGVQARMARAATQLSIREIARRAKVSPTTIVRIEAGMPANSATIEAIRRVFEAAGVEFTNGGRPGASMKEQDR